MFRTVNNVVPFWHQFGFCPAPANALDAMKARTMPLDTLVQPGRIVSGRMPDVPCACLIDPSSGTLLDVKATASRVRSIDLHATFDQFCRRMAPAGIVAGGHIGEAKHWGGESDHLMWLLVLDPPGVLDWDAIRFGAYCVASYSTKIGVRVTPVLFHAGSDTLMSFRTVPCSRGVGTSPYLWTEERRRDVAQCAARMRQVRLSPEEMNALCLRYIRPAEYPDLHRQMGLWYEKANHLNLTLWFGLLGIHWWLGRSDFKQESAEDALKSQLLYRRRQLREQVWDDLKGMCR